MPFWGCKEQRVASKCRRRICTAIYKANIDGLRLFLFSFFFFVRFCLSLAPSIFPLWFEKHSIFWHVLIQQHTIVANVSLTELFGWLLHIIHFAKDHTGAENRNREEKRTKSEQPQVRTQCTQRFVEAPTKLVDMQKITHTHSLSLIRWRFKLCI